MRKITAISIAITAMLFVSSCATQTAQQLQYRFTAAKQIDNSAERDNSLRSIAMDAADAGNRDWAMRSVEGIENAALKDNAAWGCAMKFDDQGRRPVAEEFVHLIGISALRDVIHQQFAAEAPASTHPS